MTKKLHVAILFSLSFSLFMLLAGSSWSQTYCTPTTYCSLDYINSFVTTGGSTNISTTATGCGSSSTGYSNYTAMTHTALAGATINFTMTINPTWTEGVKIWVDWNNNGNLEDAGELVFNPASTYPGGSTITGSFIIPPATTSGNKRLRIRLYYNSTTFGACLPDLVDGEIEDYTVNVLPNTCSGAPNGGTTNAAATIIPCNTTTTLSLTGNTSGTGINYQWQYNATGNWVNFGTNAATQTTPAVTQATQFRCAVTCSNPGGSTVNSTPVTVGVEPVPVNIGNDTTICPGVSYVLNAGNAGATYSWNNGAASQSITVNAAGTYSVLVTLANGCTGSDARIITPGVVPVNNLPTVTNLCAGETATLNAGNTGSTFKWTPGNATTQTINASMPGNYSVTVRSTTGCVINSSTNLIIRPLPVAALGNDTSICDGDQITLNAGNPGYTYDWSTGAATQTINVTDSGTYTVLITTPYDCELVDDKHIAYLPSPKVEGFNFVPLFYGQLGTVQFSPLNPTNVNSYLWDFGDGSATTVQVNPQHAYAAGGNYLVTLKVFNDCGAYETSLSINVDLTTGIVTLTGDEVKVALYPNPSRDYITIANNNDNLKMQEVSVFNTLGALVYKHQADNVRSHRLEVSGFASGIYSVRILTDKGFVVRKFEVLK
jgi:PKD repeat protein